MYTAEVHCVVNDCGGLIDSGSLMMTAVLVPVGTQ